MRPLRNNKNLPNLANPLTSNQSFKSNSHSIQQNLAVPHSQQLIFNSSFIPLELFVKTSQNLRFQVLVAKTGIQLKSKAYRQNLPLECTSKQWIKIDFGQTMKTIEIKPLQKQNKSFIIPTYSSELAWRSAKQRMSQTLKEISLFKSVFYLKKATPLQSQDKSFQIAIKQEKSGKTIQNRSNSIAIRPKLLSLREKSVNLSERNTKVKEVVSCSQKKQKSVFDQEKKGFFLKKRTLTSSNSTGLANRQLLNPKIQSKQRKKVKLQDSIQQIVFGNPSLNNKLFAKKPKFYQRVPFTYQEIQLKRRKFDSQCISQQSRTIEMNSCSKPTQPQDSVIIEDICKAEDSKLSCFQDTLQKGMQRSGRQVVNCSESGTLCESVFE